MWFSWRGHISSLSRQKRGVKKNQQRPQDNNEGIVHVHGQYAERFKMSTSHPIGVLCRPRARVHLRGFHKGTNDSINLSLSIF